MQKRFSVSDESDLDFVIEFIDGGDSIISKNIADFVWVKRTIRYERKCL